MRPVFSSFDVVVAGKSTPKKNQSHDVIGFQIEKMYHRVKVTERRVPFTTRDKSSGFISLL